MSGFDAIGEIEGTVFRHGGQSAAVDSASFKDILVTPHGVLPYYGVDVEPPVGVMSKSWYQQIKDRRIATQSWKVGGGSNEDELRQLIGSAPATRWTTRQTQRPGQAIDVDFGRSETFDLVRLNPGSWPTDAASGLKVEVSADGQTYREVTLEPIADIAGAYHCSERQTARHLRVTQTGRSDQEWWSIAELELYTASKQ